MTEDARERVSPAMRKAVQDSLQKDRFVVEGMTIEGIMRPDTGKMALALVFWEYGKDGQPTRYQTAVFTSGGLDELAEIARDGAELGRKHGA